MGYTTKGVPFVSGSDTSQAAAESMEESAEPLRERVFALIEATGDYGMTCKECERYFGGSVHETISPRFVELHQAQRIKDSGQRRRNSTNRKATVYVATGYRVDVKGRQDWRRVSLKRIIEASGTGGFELEDRGPYWELRIPGQSPRLYSGFVDAIQALGMLVVDGLQPEIGAAEENKPELTVEGLLGTPKDQEQ